MKPTLHKKILKLIDEHHLTSMTVDIFDTVLMREYWPSKLRRLDLAREWHTIFQSAYTAIALTPFEIFDAYTYCSHIVSEVHGTDRLDLTLDLMIDFLCTKYSVALTSDQKFQLLVSLIRTALEFEIAHTSVNDHLLDQLKFVKQLHPELKIYFLTDNRLGLGQIRTLLDIKSVDIFDGGACSSDLGASKGSGKIFPLLAAEFGSDFDLTKNLHLGDERHADFLMPTLHDSYALHYRPIRFRGLRTLIGKSALRVHCLLAHLRESRRLHNLPALQNWSTYGLLTAEAQQLLTMDLRLRAQLMSGADFLITGPNAETIYQSATDEDSNLRLATELTIENLLRAFAYLLANFQGAWDAANLLRLIAGHAETSLHPATPATEATIISLYAEISFSRPRQSTSASEATPPESTYAALIHLLLGPNRVVSPLALQSFDDRSFYTYILNEVRTNSISPSPDDPNRTAYEAIVRLLPQSQRPLYIVHRDSDAIAELFHEFARLHGITSEIHAQILDPQGIIASAEATLSTTTNSSSVFATETTKPDAQKSHLHDINFGHSLAPAVLRDVELSPDSYLAKILRPELQKIVQNLH